MFHIPAPERGEESWWVLVLNRGELRCCSLRIVEGEPPAVSLIWLFTFSTQPQPCAAEQSPCWTCVFSACSPAADPCSRSAMARRPLVSCACCQTESLSPRAVLLFQTDFSRKEQLLPAPVVLLSWPLL